MFWKIELANKEGIFDAVGEGTRRDIEDLGIRGVTAVRFIQVYWLEGRSKDEEIARIARELLTDPVTQRYAWRRGGEKEGPGRTGTWTIEVAYHPGVMDPVEESCRKALRDLGVTGISSIKTSRKYLIDGRLSAAGKKTICDRLLVNRVIQRAVEPGTEAAAAITAGKGRFRLIRIPLLGASRPELERISREGQLFLTAGEMETIQKYFRAHGRDPTDCELETLAQTWSEHCVHKTFRGDIEYEGKTIRNLLRSTIMKVTEELNRDWCVSVFQDNSGIIKFDEDYNVCFKVETHNHPSALEPYGGANTGIGGVIRDPLGTGLGAKPILNTDVFCFGPPDFPNRKLPPGVLHPKRIMKGVVAGVRDYGNRMGIPTANGAVFFDEGYVGNPLVYCGNVGLIPRDKCFKRVRTGQKIVLVGGRTGRDGIHGATFSSGELTAESETISSGAVQIGNPITEKKMTDTVLACRDRGLYEAITDCGGGGLSSAVGELGKDFGVRVDLEKVPLKYAGLTYTEIWISEAQERMILAVPPEKMEKLLAVFAAEDVEATVIGEITGDRKLRLFYEGNPVADLEMEFLHGGYPRRKRKAEWKKPRFPEPAFACPADLTADLKKILSSGNVCSKEWVIRQYDHEVQGGSVLKPLVGVDNDGPGDACVCRPRLDSRRGIIVASGINPKYGVIDPYWMAASAIEEALRQIIAVGGSLEQVALLDNFCWGNTGKPDRLGALVRAATACYDFARAFGTPFISGKDSLNNEYQAGGKSVSIPPTLLISAMAVMKDAGKAVSMDAKAAGDLVYVVGPTGNELGGSHYYAVRGFTGNRVPRVRPEAAKKAMEALSRATAKGLVRACHDCSEGGIGVAAAEMAFAGGIGMELRLQQVPVAERIERDDTLLFSESNSRFIVEVAEKDCRRFEKAMSGCAFGRAGRTVAGRQFRVYGLSGRPVVRASLAELKEAWQKTLRW